MGECTNHRTKLNMSLIETIETKQTSLGEAPHWCPIENVLYFLDILNAEIFRYDPVSNKCTSVKVPGDQSVGFVIPKQGYEGKTFVIGRGSERCELDWNSKDNCS